MRDIKPMTKEEIEALRSYFGYPYVQRLIAAIEDLQARLKVRTEERDALERLTRPQTFPQPCGMCTGTIESADDFEWHGLGNCVPICETCGGSGTSDKHPETERDQAREERIKQQSDWEAWAVRLANLLKVPPQTVAILEAVADLKAERDQARREALEEAARVMCWRCKDAEPLKIAEPDGGFGWYHIIPDEPGYVERCLAGPISALAAKEKA